MATSILVRGRQSSIEFEPPTLTLEQLKYAREAAVFVLSTTTQEQAISIFTEGLKPVKTIPKYEMVMEEEEDDNTEYNHIESHGNQFKDRDREIVTAPF